MWILSARDLRAGRRRAAMEMFAPLEARARAVAAPIPEEAPVITATFPLRGPLDLSAEDVLREEE